MRIVTLLFLCFSLAFVNVSYAQSYDKSCPMQHDSAMETMQMDPAMIADCCHDAGTTSITGKLCKTEQGCSVSTLVLFFPVPSLNFFTTDHNTPPVLSVSVPDSSPADLWRPPTLS